MPRTLSSRPRPACRGPAAPLLVGTTLLLANTKSSAVEVTAFPDANMTTPTKFIESRGHGHTISKFYSITNASDVTIVAVQYSSRLQVRLLFKGVLLRMEN